MSVSMTNVSVIPAAPGFNIVEAAAEDRGNGLPVEVHIRKYPIVAWSISQLRTKPSAPFHDYHYCHPISINCDVNARYDRWEEEILQGGNFSIWAIEDPNGRFHVTIADPIDGEKGFRDFCAETYLAVRRRGEVCDVGASE